MGNSDSDSENECFESAEESLDEEEEEISVKRKSKKSESEVIEPVSNCDNVKEAQVEKDVSGNLSYRKRPERVTRSLSNTARKSISKSPSNETIFRTEKIVPDAFFQDITNNLSKNINKSLNTLHQKSSNVKDLILNSLPVSSINDNEKFSYDDTTFQMSPDENDLTNTEHNSEDSESSNLKHVEDDAKKQTQDSEEQKSTLEIDALSVCGPSSNSNEGKPPDKADSILDTNSSGDFNLKKPLLADEISNSLQEKQKDVQFGSGDARNKITEESNKEDLKIQSENENVQNCDKISSSKTEPVFDHTESSSKEISKTELNISSCSQQGNKEIEISNSKCSESEKARIETQEHPSIQNTSEFQQPNKAFTDEVSKNLLENESSAMDSENSSRNQEVKDDFIKLKEPESELNQKCNLEELKTVLENIVKIEENNSKSQSIENQPEIKDTEEENNEEINASANDGWDDFDFSDDEIENIDTSESATERINFSDKVPEVKEVVAGGISTTNSKKITEAKAPTKVANFTSSNKKLNKEDHATKEQQSTKTEVAEDNWDWDSWDEPSDNNKNTVESPSKSKPHSREVNKKSPDLSKWSGWDTFAQKPQEKQGNWGLGLGLGSSWGVDVLLNKATAVTQGISNVLEAGLGAPDPETLARMEKIEREKQKDVEVEDEYHGEIPKKNSLTNVNLFPVSGITSLVAGVTSKIVEHSKIQEIGSKVITGGLDTLETFGKKTMEVLQEGDPGLKNKRALLMGNNKPVLSQVLKEAREKAEREMKKVEEKELAKKCHFETLFDDFQGMVHLEALEMLSRQCELKLEQIRSGMNSEEQEDLNGILEEVEKLCALDEFDSDFKSSVLDFKTALQMAVEPLQNEISVIKIVQVHEGVNKWLEMSSETKPSLAVINQKLVSTVAELAAATVHQFHKSGELLSVKECRKTVEEVDALSRLTNILCSEINRICDKFMLLSHSNSINRGDENLNSFSEKVTVVMKNSTSYIRQAFDLLIPVIQLGAAV